VRREVFYDILIEFEIPRRVIELIQMCLNETYSTVHIGKYQSGMFLFRMAGKGEKLYHHCF
jgi:hypothetical protein